MHPTSSPEPAPPHSGARLRVPPIWPYVLVLLALICATPAAYIASAPVYQATGMLQFHYPGGSFIPPLRIDTFARQALDARSKRTIRAALASPPWKATKDRASPEAFASRLETSAQGEVIIVQYCDTDPSVAAAAVNATCAACISELLVMRQEDRPRVAQLDDRRAALMAQIVVVDRRILELANVYGTADLAPLIEAKAEELTAMKAQAQSAPPLNLISLRQKIEASKAELIQMQETKSEIARLQSERVKVIQEKTSVLESLTNLWQRTVHIPTIIQSATPAASPIILDNRRRNTKFTAVASLSLLIPTSWIVRKRLIRRRAIGFRGFTVVFKPAEPIQVEPLMQTADSPTQ